MRRFVPDVRGLVDVRHALPGVGENLRDHYAPRTRWAIGTKGITYNDTGRGLGLVKQALRYAFYHEGMLGSVTAKPVARIAGAEPDRVIRLTIATLRSDRLRPLSSSGADASISTLWTTSTDSDGCSCPGADGVTRPLASSRESPECRLTHA